MQAYDEATETATVSARVPQRECQITDYARRSTVEGSLDTGSIPVYSTLASERFATRIASFTGDGFSVLVFIKGECVMNMSEAARVILGLRAAGWNEKEINDFILYIETGEEQYKPKQTRKNESYDN